MRLAFPLGLLSLLFIIGLILIYILKPKYQDKKFASTYIWKLSLKYVKRRVPLQWLKSSLLFLIQLLIFAVFAFMLARPILLFPNSKGEKIVILDGSASMTAQVGDKSRFDRAKEEIATLADKTAPDDYFTLILAANDASCIVNRTESAGFVRQKLSETECALTDMNVAKAMELAEEVLEKNPQAEVHLYTDHDYEDSGKVIVHNVSKAEWNVAIVDVTAKRIDGKYAFTAKIAAYGEPTEFAVGLTVDGKKQVPQMIPPFDESGIATVEWGVDKVNISSYESAKVTLQGVEDAFLYDNEFELFNSNAEIFRVQLVSEDPGFLQRSLLASGTSEITVVSEETPAQTSGFDLYIYDGVLPDERPTDGAVWLINPPFDDAKSSSLLQSEWGLSFSGKHTGEYALSASGKTSETYNAVMRSVSLANIVVTEYSEIEECDGYESIILCDGNPTLLTKDEDGLKTIVLGFDIHKSDIPINPYFPLLVRNLCGYAFTSTVADTLYTVGETVKINAKANAVSMTVKAVYVDGVEEEMRISTAFADFRTSAPGSYTVTQVLANGRIITANFFVRISEGESAFGKTESVLENPVVVTDGSVNTSSAKESKDIFIYLAAAMLVIVCVEWGLQYREQF